MDPFQLEDDGLDPKNILGLPEGLHMKEQSTQKPFDMTFLGLKVHY